MNWRIDGYEPLFTLLTYIFSRVISYEIFVIITTFILIFLFYIYLIKNGLNNILICYIILSNYYLLVLSIGILRFKVAIIIFLVYLITNNKISLLASFVAHFQTLAFLAIHIVREVLKKGIILYLITSVIVVIATYYLYSNHYIHQLYFNNAIRSLIIVIGSLFILMKVKVNDILVLIFLIFTVLILDDYRMNMIIFAYLFGISIRKIDIRTYVYNVIMGLYFLFKTNFYLIEHYSNNMII